MASDLYGERSVILRAITDSIGDLEYKMFRLFLHVLSS